MRSAIPLSEFRTEAFSLFASLLDSLREDVTQKLGQIRPVTPEEQEAMVRQYAEQQAALQKAITPEAPVDAPEPLVAGFDENDPATWGNPGRNDPCPCGSGNKFKHCHGKLV